MTRNYYCNYCLIALYLSVIHTFIAMPSTTAGSFDTLSFKINLVAYTAASSMRITTTATATIMTIITIIVIVSTVVATTITLIRSKEVHRLSFTVKIKEKCIVMLRDSTKNSWNK